MTKRRSRFAQAAAAASLVFASLLLPGLPSSAVPSAPAAPAAGISPDPVSRFGACLADSGEGDLLLLIDESGSLQTTDPQAARVTAVTYLLRQLGQFADTADVTLNVRFAVFGHRYLPLGDWVALDGSTTGSLTKVASTLASHDNGFDTDYWTALENSRRDLADQRATHAEGSACQAIAWFTDGQLDYDPRVTEYQKQTYGETKPFAPDVPLNSETAAKQVAKIATKLICTDGGLADQLRSSDVTMFVIGLDARNEIDFSLVQSIATGQAPSGASCGKIVEPTPGIFITAADIDGLLFAFDALSTPGQNPIHIEEGICQVTTCLEETHKFVLDQSTPVVHILASAEVGGLDVSLIAPSGDVFALEPKTVGETHTAEGAAGTASYAWRSERTLTIDLSRVGDGAWSGLWQLAFVDPAGVTAGKKSFSNIRISSDFLPAILEPAYDSWHRDDAFDLGLGIVDASGEPIDPATIEGEVLLSAHVIGSDGTDVELADGLDKTDLLQPLAVDLGDFPLGPSTVVLELVHTTAPIVVDGQVSEPGTELQPQTVEIGVPILPPLDFPLAATSIDFGVLDGVTQASSEISVEGDGCVWLDLGSLEILAGPEEAGKLSITTSQATDAAHCVTASEGGLLIDFAAAQAANGSVNGTIDVMLSPTGEPERAIPSTVSFSADLRKPLDVGRTLSAFVIALVLGIGIPVGLVYLAKLLIAKIPSRALLTQRIAVEVSDGRVLRGGAPIALRDDDLRDLTGIPSGGTRSLSVAGVELSTRIGAAPTGAGYVLVESPGFVGASDSTPPSAGKNHWARLPLAVHNHWIVLRPAGAATTQVEVVLFVSGDAGTERKADLIDDLSNRLPDVLARLDEVAGDEPAAADPEAGWGSSSNEGAGFDFSDDASSDSGSGSSGYSGFGFSDSDDAR